MDWFYSSQKTHSSFHSYHHMTQACKHFVMHVHQHIFERKCRKNEYSRWVVIIYQDGRKCNRNKKLLLLECLYSNVRLSFSHSYALNCSFQSCSVPPSAPLSHLELLLCNRKNTAELLSGLLKKVMNKKANFMVWSKETQAKHMNKPDLHYIGSSLFLFYLIVCSH